MARKYVIPLDYTGEEVLDFVGPSQPQLFGRAAKPDITTGDKPVLFRVLTWNNPDPPPMGRRSRLIQPEYDFNEIAKAHDTDGILRSSRDKQLTCMMKDTWWLGGQNPRTVGYVQKRLNEISRMSPMPFSMVLRSCAQNLVEYGNFFLYLHRQSDFSSGKSVNIAGKGMDPIAAIHPLDVTTLRPVMGDTAEVKSWVQILQSPSLVATNSTSLLAPLPSDRYTMRYDSREIIHGYAWRRSGYIYGTPPCVPVLDDVRALRRLEEISEIVAHRHAFPLVHISVGTEKQPARMLGDGSSEIDIVKNAYESMKLEGAFITSERATVTAITLKPWDLTELLQHFTNRIVTGLGLSDVDIGRGGTANRGTASVMASALLSRCRELQQILQEFILWQLFDVLLAEGGFEDTPENRVYLKFPEVDIERMMSIGNYATNLYNSHAITETEMRQMMGRDPISNGERKEMVFELVEKPIAIIKAIDEPWTESAKAAIKNRNQPTNQSGTKAAKTRPMNDTMSAILDNVKELKTKMISYVLSCIKEEKSIDDRELWELNEEFSKKISDSLVTETEPSIYAGFEKYKEASKSAATFIYTGSLKRRFTKHCIAPVLDKLVGDRETPGELNTLINRLRTSTDGRYVLRILSYFDTWTPILEGVCNKLNGIAERFGLCQATWLDGAHSVGWKQNDIFRALGPAQASYYSLVDRAGFELSLVLTDNLPSEINILVEESRTNAHGCDVKLKSEVEGLLDLSKPGRKVSVVFDSGDRIILPDDIIENFECTKDTIRIPRPESGIIEVWDNGRIVGKTRFVVPTNKHLLEEKKDE